MRRWSGIRRYTTKSRQFPRTKEWLTSQALPHALSRLSRAASDVQTEQHVFLLCIKNYRRSPSCQTTDEGVLGRFFPQAKDNSLSVNSQPCAGHCRGTPDLPPINCILQQLVLLLLLSRIDSSMASSENETRPGGDDCVGNGRGGRRGIRKPRREPAVAATRREGGREGGREDHGSGRSWFSRLSGPE